MPCSGCSALHGMNPSFYKIPNNHRMLKKIYGEYNFVAFFPDEIRNCSVTHPRHKCQNSLEKMNEYLMHCNTCNLRALSKNVSRRFSTIFCFLNQTVCVDLLGNETNNFLFSYWYTSLYEGGVHSCVASSSKFQILLQSKVSLYFHIKRR